MCIIHDQSQHYLFQNMLDAFEKSKMLSALFLRRVGCLICTCKKDLFFDSKTIISTQRSLYQWFEDSLQDAQRPQLAIERLVHFKPIVEELRKNGRIDSGTKITFLTLLRDLDNYDFSKLRHLTDQMANKKKASKRNIFFIKLVILKFDLKMCSVKEFCELIQKIDNSAIKYIQLTNKCKIVIRDIEHLSIRNFMGELEATIEAKNEKNLYRAELSLKRLADAVHYRLAKQIPSSDGFMVGGGSFSNLKVLLQSPPDSKLTTPNDTSIDMSSSSYSAANTTNTSGSSKINLTSLTTTTGESAYSCDHISFKSNTSTLNNEADQNDSMITMSNDDNNGNTTPMTSSPMSSSSNNSPFKFKLDDNNKKKSTKKKTNKKLSSNSNKIQQPIKTSTTKSTAKPASKTGSNSKKQLYQQSQQPQQQKIPLYQNNRISNQQAPQHKQSDYYNYKTNNISVISQNSNNSKWSAQSDNLNYNFNRYQNTYYQKDNNNKEYSKPSTYYNQRSSNHYNRNKNYANNLYY